MRNWGFKNNKITNIGIKDFFRSFYNKNIVKLKLNLDKWACWHAQITDDCLKEL